MSHSPTSPTSLAAQTAGGGPGAGGDLTLTVIGLPAGQGIFKYEDGGPEWHAPIDSLPSVEVKAGPDDSLRSVLVRGAAALGVTLTPSVRRGRAAAPAVTTNGASRHLP